MKLKDRVRVVSAPTHLNNAIGSEGTIETIGTDTIVVSLDEPFENSDGERVTKTWFKPEELELIDEVKLWIDTTTYWFKGKNDTIEQAVERIRKIEEMKQAKHMGYWCTKAPGGYWNEQPVDVFYVANPDKSKGHSNYFGLFYGNGIIRDEGLYIVNGESAFSEPMTGLLGNHGEVVVSRYRHDFRHAGSGFIDGGRDYTHTSGGTFVTVTVKDGEFHFEKVPFEAVTHSKEDDEYYDGK